MPDLEVCFAGNLRKGLMAGEDLLEGGYSGALKCSESPYMEGDSVHIVFHLIPPIERKDARTADQIEVNRNPRVIGRPAICVGKAV